MQSSRVREFPQDEECLSVCGQVIGGAGGVTGIELLVIDGYVDLAAEQPIPPVSPQRRASSLLPIFRRLLAKSVGNHCDI
jgi:hypothetical protein